ncbi:hypothetical protein [Pseudomonas sp.]|uniref:hypothetical protein n=1 Tax=Pseudomonas sp. TaxID=306 RepID=UPI002906785D|nr:hypothetical protein [Pseudomonas sp.]MDU4250496.1 hypothetical protein [Pseudomonas sp.]
MSWRERPILFSGAMVRAILEGRKTVTRRLVKPAFSDAVTEVFPYSGSPEAWMASRPGDPQAPWHEQTRECPFGKPGDRLWVRETWSDVNMYGAPALAYRADGDIRDLMAEDLFLGEDGSFNYVDQRWKKLDFCCWYADLHLARWRPSIHLPRWASRILLEITAVRVERLQDISEAQAEAEGVERPENITNVDVWDGAERELFNAMNQPRARFRRLWGDINGQASWDSNPWVWVVEFKVVEGLA